MHIEEMEAYEFCTYYHPERKWCKEHHLDMSELGEEIKFQ